MHRFSRLKRLSPIGAALIILIMVVMLYPVLPPVRESQAAWSEPAIAPVMMTAPLTPPPVTGSTFYVDKSNLGGACNNNNPGTQTQPWCTITKATQTLTAGQRAYVRAGTYNETGLRTTNSGTPGNYITFEAFPGEHPLINCAGNFTCFDATPGVPGWSYVVWNGFDAYSPNQQYFVGTNTNSHHIWFVNGKFHDNGAIFSGFEIYTHHIVLSNNEIYNTGRMAAYTNNDQSLTPTPDAHDTIFEFNQVHDNSRNGDDDGAFKCGGNDYNCVMRYNTVWNNWRNPSSSTICFSPGNCQGVTGLYFDIHDNTSRGGMSYIYKNIIHDNDIGLQVNVTKGVRVFNNLVYHNGFNPGTYNTLFGKGITINNTPSGDIQLFNNTSYGNRNEGFELWNTPAGVVTSRNNLIQNNGANSIQYFGGATNLDLDYDLLSTVGATLIRWNSVNYGTLGAFQARSGNTTWTHGVGTPATFVNAGANDYHLTSTSAGVNAGTPVSLFNFDLQNAARPQGSAWDMGAYEFASGGTPAPTVSLSASPTSITSGQSSTLTWSSTNATSCTWTAGLSGSAALSGSQSVSPTVTTTYTLSCTGAGGTGSQSTTVTVGGTPSTNPVGWWKLDETGGTAAADSSGSNAGQLVGGPIWMPTGGKINGALSFDGVDDYVDIANESNFDLSTSFTVAAWIKTNSTKAYNDIVTKGNGGSGFLDNFLMRMEDSGGVKKLMGRHGVGGTSENVIRGTTALNDNNWHHVTFVRDDSTSKLYLYVDGTPDATPVSSTGAPNLNNNNVRIGEWGSFTTGAFSGPIDDVRVYNRALTHQRSKHWQIPHRQAR